MSTPQPTTHILDRANYSHHRLVTLTPQDAHPLAPSSLRLRTKLLGLTTNNLTYARFGHLMGWYDIYPLPPNTPAPYNDASAYGRIAGWGYADIVESTVPGVEVGKTVYGFLSVSSGLEDVVVEFAKHSGKEIKDQLIVINPHRQHVWKIYNRYQLCASLPELETSKGADFLGWDALMQGLFATGYNLSTFGFAWTERNLIHPSGEGKGVWTMKDADLRGACVVVLNASGKTGMAFAYALKLNRPVEYQPNTVVGVGSSRSVDVIEKSGLYDQVTTNEDVAGAVEHINASKPHRLVILDFGAREGVAQSWSETLTSSPSLSATPLTQITVGGEVKIQDPAAAQKRLRVMNSTTVVHAGLLREKGIEVGGERYFEEFYEAFEGFKGRDVGIELSWGEGLEGWRDGWEKLCGDEVKASMGLVYRI